MEHTIEVAASGRSKCRGCGQRIEKDDLRLGERLPNPFAEDSLMTLWFHPRCGAYKRPAVLAAALEASAHAVEDAESLKEAAAFGVEHRRLPRVDGAERAPSGRARCRACREMIEKGGWRIRLVYFEDGRFEPSGFVHLACAETYFGTRELVDRLAHFTPDLPAGDLEEIRASLAAG